MGAFILTHVLLAVAVEFCGLALLVRVVLLFVDEHGLACLRQFGIRLLLAEIIEVLAHTVLLTHHVVHIGVLVSLAIVMSTCTFMLMIIHALWSRLFNHMGRQVLHRLGSQRLIKSCQMVDYLVELLGVDVE